MAEQVRRYTAESGQGRVDDHGVEWFACDPYPYWYRYDDDGVLHTLGMVREWEKDVFTPTKDEAMEHGRLLIVAGRNWRTLTEEDIERGARAVVSDCCYRAEIGRCAIQYAEETRNPDLKTALRQAWDALNVAPCACGRTQPR